jgi:hypothetical protein
MVSIIQEKCGIIQETRREGLDKLPWNAPIYAIKLNKRGILWIKTSLKR